MREMTWNTWRNCERISDANRMKASCEAHLSLVRYLLLSASLDCFPLFRWQHTALAQGPHSSHFHAHVPCVISLCVSDWLDFSIHFFSFLHFSRITLSSFCPTTPTSSMWWTNTLRTSAEDFGTLAENEPPTGYEPNAHFITEASVEYTMESSGEQRPPNDFDYDDVTIGKMLSDACRRRANQSEEESLSSSLSSSVSHDRTVSPVVCRLVSSARETQRQLGERTD